MAIILAILLAAEPWVLWVEYSSYDREYKRSVVAEGAYVGAQECMADARTKAVREVELYKTFENVKKVTRSTLMAGQEIVRTELKRGGTQSFKYMCFPHPVKPE
jgi:hypothetical protein